MMKRVCIILLVAVFVFSGCGNRTPISAKTFKDTLSEKDFSLKGEAKFLTDENAVVGEKGNLHLEFQKFDDEKEATTSHKAISRYLEGVDAEDESETTVGNYSVVTRKTSSKYYMAIRVKDTVIYAEGPADASAEFKELLKSFGY